MKKSYPIIQLLLRYSVGIGFLLPVMDRLGYFGAPGETNVIWGNWTSFVAYTHQLMPYVDLKTASFFGFLATAIEIICGILLLVGYKVRYAALASFGLTFIFAISMMFFLHFRAPFNFSVFVVSFSSLLLSTLPHFSWSIDNYFYQRNKSHQ
ncbi:DoxX family protein [Sphingobacterium kitahiroshimense]|uniref:DoxX family protein n=1 Tax=Sphingobacterium sp. B16(2022) TaxID=2914044 RepID=UPI001438DC49|nr:DoxX family protein [Sphingobacterium sp. B16(2022)]NJI73255.1 DoxX family protein [Sphingobacterium sp. B16(2022)]